MGHSPLLQQVLGSDWESLPPVIRRHYQLAPAGQSLVQGLLEISYPSYLKPLIWLIHLCGGLIYQRGKDIPTRVVKRQSPETAALCWQRTLRYPDGRQDTFASRMLYSRPHELVEIIGFGFGLKLTVDVEQQTLVYRSNGHLWRCAGFQFRIPDWLVLGSATIVERPVSEGEFSLDFTIRHPLIGTTYYYRGSFGYGP